MMTVRLMTTTPALLMARLMLALNL